MKFKRDFSGLFLSLLFAGAQLEASGTSLALRESYGDEQKYDEVSYLTTHNAFTFNEDGWEYYQQSLNFDGQFDYGVWSFMIDLHYCWTASDDLFIALAHQPGDSSNRFNYSEPGNHHLPSCLISSGQKGLQEHRSLESFLREHVEKWLREDNEAIITLHLESYTGRDGARQLRDLFRKSGVLDYIYRKSSSEPWPTLGGMRKANTRLVLFSSNKADSDLGDVFYTDHYRETCYDLNTYENCERRFDDRDVSNTTTLLVLNHFYKWAYAATKHSYHQINNPYATGMAYKYKVAGKLDLATRTNRCIQQEGIYPSFVVVDFVEEGDAGGARDWVLHLNQQRRDERSSVPLFFKAGSSSESSVPRRVSSVFSLNNIGSTISAVLALGSYRYPQLAKPAALTGALTLISLLETPLGHYVPAVFSPITAIIQWSAFYPLLLRFHPVYGLVWLIKNDVRNPHRFHQD